LFEVLKKHANKTPKKEKKKYIFTEMAKNVDGGEILEMAKGQFFWKCQKITEKKRNWQMAKMVWNGKNGNGNGITINCALLIQHYYGY
jgi:hypothetical protein